MRTRRSPVNLSPVIARSVRAGVLVALALSQVEVTTPCADAGCFEVGVPELRCQLWEESSGGWISSLTDGVSQLHNRARHHTA